MYYLIMSYFLNLFLSFNVDWNVEEIFAFLYLYKFA